MKHTDPRYPNTGDIVGCSDGDVGVVLKTYFNTSCQLVIKVAWSSGKTYTDPWDAKDFVTVDDMFHIMSRA